MEMYSFKKVEYDNTRSLRSNLLRLSVLYAPKHVVRRVDRLIRRNGMRLSDVKGMAVLLDDKMIYFRVYFNTFCVDVPEAYVLYGKN